MKEFSSSLFERFHVFGSHTAAEAEKHAENDGETHICVFSVGLLILLESLQKKNK
jgi:hypothetical protein